MLQVTELAASGPAAKAGALLMEGDGRNVTNLEVKQFKEITKGPPGLLIKLRAQRGGSVYEAVLERSGAAMTLHEEMHRLKAGLATTVGVLGKTKEELKTEH